MRAGCGGPLPTSILHVSTTFLPDRRCSIQPASCPSVNSPVVLAFPGTASAARRGRVSTAVKYFCVVTNRAEPEGGDAGDLLRWHRGKAGTVEHAHDVLGNELAAAALPSQKFGANAAWFRLNVVLYNLLSAFKRLGPPGTLHCIRPKRRRFLVFNTLARVICHSRERLLRCWARPSSRS